MLTKTPRVSVLTPIYNTNPTHLRQMIESILNQTFSNFEFLILNDSPNNKELGKIVKSYKDKRIRYYENKKNLGISASRNRLLDLARGEYLAIFDHDDISAPERLAKEVKVLDANPFLGAVSGQIKYFDCKKEGYITGNPEHDYEIRCALTDGCYFAHTAAMLRKSILDKNNIRYEACFSPCEDYQLWNRLMDITQFYNIQDVLVLYRAFDGNTTHAQKIKMGRYHNAISLEIQNRYPAHHRYWSRFGNPHRTQFRLRFLGIPLLKIKNNTLYLFECIPVFTIKWK